MISVKNTSQSACELTVDKPATYCIRVVGYLDENWSDRLGGLRINSSARKGKTAVTTLSGPLIDQAALFGVLKALYDMRLPLLSVECLQINLNHFTYGVNHVITILERNTHQTGYPGICGKDSR